jgi:ceramide glucosyltransferase
MAFRKADLDRIGGFEVLLDLLADDYELGARMCESGKRVYLADVIVETYLPAYGWRDFCRHQLRWARSIRDSRPWGYLGLAITYAIPWAMLGVVFAGGAAWAWALLAVALLSRWAVAFAVGVSVLSDHQVRRFWWLIPVRDCLALVLWAAAYAGRTVYWRGDKFILKNGRLTRVSQQKRNSSNL